jgi:hypothetical protein
LFGIEIARVLEYESAENGDDRYDWLSCNESKGLGFADSRVYHESLLALGDGVSIWSICPKTWHWDTNDAMGCASAGMPPSPYSLEIERFRHIPGT